MGCVCDKVTYQLGLIAFTAKRLVSGNRQMDILERSESQFSGWYCPEMFLRAVYGTTCCVLKDLMFLIS